MGNVNLIYFENHKGRDHLENLGIEGKLLLKLFVRNLIFSRFNGFS